MLPSGVVRRRRNLRPDYNSQQLVALWRLGAVFSAAGAPRTGAFAGTASVTSAELHREHRNGAAVEADDRITHALPGRAGAHDVQQRQVVVRRRYGCACLLTQPAVIDERLVLPGIQVPAHLRL